MQTEKMQFGEYEGKPVYKLSLTNKNGVTVSGLTLGATLFEFATPNKTNLVLNYPTVAEYENSGFYLCMGIGRTAGRISDGKFSIDGHQYQVDTNENGSTLHGGPHGFSSINWEGNFSENQIIFTTEIKSSYDSYPGNLKAKIVFELDDDDTLTIRYAATTDANTLFNPTNHVYFNMGNQNNILNETLEINSDTHLALDDRMLPTGEFIENDVEDAYNFKNPKAIGKALEELKKETGLTHFDTPFALRSHKFNTPTAKLCNPDNGTKVTIRSDRNGLVVFTADPFNKESNAVKSIALESQMLPDTPNHPDFGNVDLLKDDSRQYRVSYHLDY